MKYKYIIIEDNTKTAENLKYILSDYPNYVYKGLAMNIKKGLELIATKQPDIMFLDIKLGTEIGFDIIKLLLESKSKIPFVIVNSTEKEYAIQSFKIDAIDFIDKPYTFSKVETALLRFEKKYAENNKIIELSNAKGKHYINKDDIYFLEAKGAYTYIYTITNLEYKFSKDLKQFIDLLPSNFVRVQKSYIININHQNIVKNQILHLKNYQIKNPLEPIKYVVNNGIKTSTKFLIETK